MKTLWTFETLAVGFSQASQHALTAGDVAGIAMLVFLGMFAVVIFLIWLIAG